MFLREEGQITITDKISPEGFAAAQQKSKSTGSQINVSVGTTTNSNGGNGIEAKLDPQDTSTNINKSVTDAKETGLETSFVSPIENFSDYNQMRSFSDRISNVSGVDEGTCRTFKKSEIKEARKKFLEQGAKTYEKKDFYNRGGRR